MEEEQNEIDFDCVVEAVKASLKENDNVNIGPAEYVKKEKELINDIITNNKNKDINNNNNNQKTLEEILRILNNNKYITLNTNIQNKDININMNNINENNNQ